MKMNKRQLNEDSSKRSDNYQYGELWRLFHIIFTIKLYITMVFFVEIKRTQNN